MLDAKQPTPADRWRTRSDLPLDPVYGPESVAARGVDDLAGALGAPGTPPFARGVDAGGYRDKAWIVGQYAGFGSAEDANRRYRQLLAEGQTGFSVALDLPTQMGLDSDHTLAEGEVGQIGVAIDSLADMEVLFDGIDIEQIRQIRTTANAIGPIWLALVVAMCERRGVDPASVAILIQNDILKEYVARGTYIYPPAAGLRLVVDTIEHCAEHLPSWTPVRRLERPRRRRAGRHRGGGAGAADLRLLGRLGADGPAADEQRRPGLRRGARRRARLGADDPHRRLRRGVRHTVGRGRPARPANPADPSRGVRPARRRRPAPSGACSPRRGR